MAERRRYRKISVRMWGDEKFCMLSRPQPNAQTLWIYLLTAPETTTVPGVFTIGEAGMAEALRWNLKAFRRAFTEIVDAGMVLADWGARLVWVPKAYIHNPPESPNVASAWRASFGELPECRLKRLAEVALTEFLTELGPSYITAWNNGCADLGERAEWQSRRRKIPLEVTTAVRERDQDSCRYCGLIVNWTDRRGPHGGTYDHVEPKGPETADNIVVACRLCNSIKGNRTPTESGLTLSYLGSDLGNDLSVAGNQEQEQEQKQEHETDTPLRRRATDPVSDGFEVFWLAYPKKKAKGTAERAWRKLSPSPDLLQRILVAISVQRNSADWVKEYGRYVPHPATWLNAKRWQDEEAIVAPGPIVPVVDWFQECAALHDGACGLSRSRHDQRKQLDEFKQQRASA